MPERKSKQKKFHSVANAMTYFSQPKHKDELIALAAPKVPLSSSIDSHTPPFLALISAAIANKAITIAATPEGSVTNKSALAIASSDGSTEKSKEATPD